MRPRSPPGKMRGMKLDYARPRHAQRSHRAIFLALAVLVALTALTFVPVWPHTGYSGRTWTTFWRSDYFTWRIG